ncbi:hypothetical protein BDF22DRAFT_742304 [Syncephalis plumigaleata]|nr:hypothetical protein BDF22DRAFT_742304 [Syncephalis plumigaleata]
MDSFDAESSVDASNDAINWWSLLPSIIVYGGLCLAGWYLLRTYHPSLFDRPIASDRKQQLDAERRQAYARMQAKLASSSSISTTSKDNTL